MNKFISLAALASAFFICSTGINAQTASKDAVLMTVGGKKITVGEFEAIYRKNGKDVNNNSQSLMEYVNMFVNFKLKVREAEELKMDTATAFRNEYETYRKQLSQPYLTDREVSEQLIKEAYDRMHYQVRASHILVKVDEDALPKDTLAAYNKIMKIRQRILKGEDFNKVAGETGISDDPSAKENQGDIGYFTAFSTVYPFESAAYNAKVGDVTMPVRSSFGYHIIKVTDKIENPGDIKIAHIWIRYSKQMKTEDSLNVAKKAQEIYAKIKAGESFATLAQQFSDDKASAQRGGELDWFSFSNTFPKEFSDAAFALKNKGDVSGLVHSSLGWNILQKIDQRPIASFEEMRNELKNKVSRNPRSKSLGRTSLVNKLKKEYNFKENTEIKKKKTVFTALDEVTALLDSTIFTGTWSAQKATKLNKELFSFAGKSFNQKEFAEYIEKNQSARTKTDYGMVINGMYKNFVESSFIAYEETQLERKYPEFKALLQEYRDGILLFELTDKNVWSKAIKDTAGLKEFFEKNKNNYMWDERSNAIIYNCADKKTADLAYKLVKKGAGEKEVTTQLNKNSQLNVSTQSALFNKKENTLVDNNWKPGLSAIQQMDGRFQFVKVVAIVAPTPKALSDIRGIATSDYQAYLEKQWLEDLHKKYAVDLDTKILSSIQ